MTRKTIAVIGDPMIDVFISGSIKSCQDGCLGFQEIDTFMIPGGAANAANCLRHTDAHIILLGPVSELLRGLIDRERIDVSPVYPCVNNPLKTRHVDYDTGKIAFRSDRESLCHGLSANKADQSRDWSVKVIKGLAHLDGVYVADYDKGFLTESLIQSIVYIAGDRGIPVVVDPKRHPRCAAGAILKCNGDYFANHYNDAVDLPAAVVTHGCLSPALFGENTVTDLEDPPPVPCVNHVGAGDCFGVHLVLALARGQSLKDAAAYAHAAGRVYVQHPRNRAPYPHEIARDLDPLGGKVLDRQQLAILRESTREDIVFTNGVFRLPHAGHAWFLDWARKQGDLLVVGVNDDSSAARIRHGECCLPLAERLGVLTGLGAVDYVVPFTEDDPSAIIGQLQPDLLVKGNDYAGQRIPGDDQVGAVRFSPPFPHARHCTDYLRAFRGAS
jgi:rfaE bifunctional protein nucleotidyltransferase chain/domain